MALALAALITCSLLVSACADATAVTATDTVPPNSGVIVTHADLIPGEPVEADLDGDGALERILLDPSDYSIFIEDGSITYRSRDRWRVVQAGLGDLDGDGLTEVIALLDSEAGRHIGLFAYFGREYRERLVSQAIDPAPVSFRVITTGRASTDGAAQLDPAQSADTRTSDTLELLQPPSGAGGAPQTLRLRWNGFGFTRIE